MTTASSGPSSGIRPHRSPWHRNGIGLRLLAAQVLVLAAGAATTWVVAAVVGPPLFREHLHRAGVPANSMEELHAEEAYGYATVLAMGGALAVSMLAALAVSWYVSRRLRRSITEIAAAATGVAEGRYETRVSPPRLGEDFDALAEAFNQMAARLQAVEATRHQLFGDLAHEIRTPVAVLEAYLEALEDGVRTLTPQTAAMLRDQTHRLVRFSEDVSALARAEESPASMVFAPTDVADLATRCAAAARAGYDAKGVALLCEARTPLPPLWGDRQRLAQVLNNLLDNALRHTPAGGTVRLCAAREGQNDGTGGTGENIVVRVIDTGDGIAAEHLPHVFERFYRADPSRSREHGGAGIGLAITRALVSAHGGTVTAASAGPGRGSTFTVTLPLAAAGQP
ncbi:sensor histidine kinase [Mycolicibacterium palauense]|uniref:sensor histidine kinase n=1 Tax=Mycolicibacterium palauense TaxID=2034511 RepID=UPI000BFEE52E|nr:HAMP domain-containing sensor histidine kinase [Mycolicibacterium palauense]